jgi:flagellar operon protein
MVLSDYLRLQNRQMTVTTGTPAVKQTQLTDNKDRAVNAEGMTFEDALRLKLEQGRGVAFSGHALKRIDSRNIDVDSSETLERLNRGVELAAEKGSNDALVLVDETAFVVSVKNNRVITTLSREDLKGNVFTNIDSAVIV